LLFLTLDPRRVARIMVAWAVASYALTLLLAGWLGYRAPSAAQIVTAAIALVVFDRLLRSQGSVPLIRGVAPGAIALVVVAVPGLLLASMIESPSATIALALGVAAAQILMMEKLSRRSVRDDARSLVDGLAGTVRALQAIRR
jgi:O-antigen/teichoic acid export membrane protein